MRDQVMVKLQLFKILGQLSWNFS